MEEVDVFVTDPTTFDLEVYDLWLKGLSETEASEHQQKQGYLQHLGASPSIIASDIGDQYRVFLVLEHFLQNPSLLENQLMLQIPSDLHATLIERYYEFDNSVIRELLGKKLTARLRKDLDDISERTIIALKSCKRQYDNIKNIFKAVEDSTGGLVENIKRDFSVSEKLAKNYSCIVFMAYNKFETGKKRLSYLTFADFAYCVEYMIVKWTITSADVTDADTDLDMDKNFLQDLRDLRTFYSDKDISDEHKSAVFAEIEANDSTELSKTYDPHVKNFDRILINIGAGLIHQKEMKDIFIDLVEKFLEPCKQLNLTVGGLSIFLQALTTTCEKLSSIKKAGLQRLVPVYLRYMTVIHKCIIRMYPGL